MVKSTVNSQLSCGLITLIYFFFGGLWAVFADQIFTLLFYQSEYQKHSVVYSHWFFVAVSTVALLLLLKFWKHEQEESKKSLNIVHRSFNGFSKCIQAIAHADNELKLLQDVCRICVETGGHRMAWVAYAEDDEQKTLKHMTHWGEKSCFIDCIQATWENTERGQGPPGSCIRTGEAVVFQSLQTNKRYKFWQEAAQKCGFSSSAAFPLKADRKTFGALVVYNEKPNAFDKGEISLLNELAKNLSYGLETLRLRENQQEEIDERLMLAAATDQTSDGVITFNRAGTIQYMNPSFMQLCGVPANQAVGVSIHDFDCSHRNRTFYQAVLDVFRTNKVKTGQFTNKKSDGSEYEIAARISPVLNPAGEVVRYVATVRDITQEVKLQRQLSHVQKMEAVATLSGGVAHDFKNILGKIMLSSEAAFEDGSLDGQQQALMLSIYKEALRGKELIQQFMSISRQNKQPKELIKINEIVSDSMKIIRSTLPTTISIKTDCKNNCGLITGIPAQIQQALINICSNAQETMEGIGNIIEVNLSTTDIPVERQRLNPDLIPGSYVMITITDSGDGFSRDEIERIFDPFYSLKEQKDRGGLGLSVAHGIIKSHGGHIVVNSIKGVGTTFVILLPQVNSSGEKIMLMTGSQKEKKVLYVGAEKDNFDEIRTALKEIGCRVQAEIDGREALEQLHQTTESYDLIIADQGLSDMSGEMFIKEALNINPEVPIILCSEPERAAGLEKEEPYRKGNLLLKPYGTEEMCQKVCHVLHS